MRRFVAAMRFLTVIPFPGTWGADEASLAGSTVYFPAVGLLIGLGAAGISACAVRWLPAGLAAALVIVALLAVSGGLHMDGLSDTADGLLSARPRERALEIMRDSHVGAMGVIAIVCALMLKFAALASLPAEKLWRTALLMPVAGRVALVVTIALLPYARPEGGLAAPFYRRRSMLAALAAEVILLATAWLVLDMAGLIAACASLAAVLIFAVYICRRIGGATGDTLGAACEIAELIPAMAMAACCFQAGGHL
jgi:adenosylcobinamide-GDP ribazoletransferase